MTEHFPAHNAWPLLEEWKSKVGLIHGQLPALSKWVLEGLAGYEFNSLFTEPFAPTVVSNVVEDVYHGRPVDAFYRNSVENEYEISTSGAFWSVKWALVGVQYVIGTSGNQDDMEILKRRHIALREDIRKLDLLQAVVDRYRELTHCENNLGRELEHIANLAIFPGRCGLCNG